MEHQVYVPVLSGAGCAVLQPYMHDGRAAEH
jgi:hypothetical protein